MADFSYVEASFLDDDFDDFMSSLNPAEDEPMYYQAQDDDFHTQSINIKEDKPDKSESESFDSSLLEQFKENLDGTVANKKLEVENKFAFQLMLPSFLYEPFEEEFKDLSPKVFIGTVSCILFLLALGMSLLIIEDDWIWGISLCSLIFMTSLLFGVIGCWILVNEVYRDVEEEQDFVANVQGMGLWELKKQKKEKVQINLKGTENTTQQGTDNGRGDTTEGVEIDVIAPGTLDYLLHTLKMQDPVRERQIIVNGGLAFIWLANASFIACGFLSAMSQHYPSKEQREVNDIQTSLVGIAGWVLVAFAILFIFKRK